MTSKQACALAHQPQPLLCSAAQLLQFSKLWQGLGH
jgi:hypothetical protein